MPPKSVLAKRKRDQDLLDTASSLDTAALARPLWNGDCESDDLVFQLLECEDASKDKADGDSSLIRLHGVTETAESVIVLVRGFRQYIYFPVSKTFNEDDLPLLKEGIDVNVKTRVSIAHMAIVERDPLEYYRPEPDKYRRYVQIFVDKPTDVNPIGQVLGKSDELAKLINMFGSGKLYSSQVYETGLSYDMRFMADLGLVGCGWIKLKAGAYKTLPRRAPYERVSGVFECQRQAIEGLSPNSNEADDEKTAKWSKLADMRCLVVSAISLDPAGPVKPAKAVQTAKKGKTSKITASPKKPKATDDEPEPFVASISVVLTNSPLAPSSDDSTYLLTHSHASSCTIDVLPNVKTLCFKTEMLMLEAFRELLLSYDPDVITGYDVTSDAMPAIMTRALELGAAKTYPNLARCSHTSLKTKRRQIYSSALLRKERRMHAATSNREHTELGCIGRLVLDLRTVIEREERLRTYSLNEASDAVGGRKLEKLSDAVLASFWTSDDADLYDRLADYALAEVHASLNLLRHHASLITYVELSRVTGLNFEDVVSRGQMRRFWSQLFRFCGKRGIIVPGWSRGGEQMTQSALNYAPQAGYDTENPVVVLDFKSLYPSILIARNLCFSTEIPPGEQYDGAHWSGFGGCRFVDRSVKEGVVPAILEHFLAERGRVRQLMKSTSDASLRTVLDGRQKAIKVVANAVYGFMGARESRLQNLAIADGTITEGANLLELAKQEIERRYNSSPDQKDVCEVVYGDTDSVFVKLFGKSVEEAIAFGKRVSHEVSQVWPDPIQLEFEKVLFPSLLQNRKRYAGLLWTTADAPQEIDIKGIEANRRDAVPLVGTLISDTLEILFPKHKNNAGEGRISPDERQAIIDRVREYLTKSIGQIQNGALDVGQFIMTKGLWLGSDSDAYSGKQPHISVIEKMRTRDARLLFKDGERISYVFTQGAPNAKGFEKAEDPVYAIDKGLLLDYQYYVDHTVHNPLQRILELFMPPKEVDAIFRSTAKTKVAIKPTAGIMGAFVMAGKKTLAKCAVCGETSPAGKKLCTKHAERGQEMAEAKLAKLQTAQGALAEATETCHGCMRRADRPILCTNMDCAVYFRRKRADEDKAAAQEDLATFTKAEGIDLSW